MKTTLHTHDCSAAATRRALVEDAVMAVLDVVLALGSDGLVGLFQRLRDYPHGTATNTDPDASHTQGS